MMMKWRRNTEEKCESDGTRQGTKAHKQEQQKEEKEEKEEEEGGAM
jgi:hypothetical protein